MKERKFFYRLFDGPPGFGKTEVHLDRFPVLKETACGAWINIGSEYDFNPEKKFIRLTDCCQRPYHKRWACPTVEEAIASYRLRKAMQVAILKSRLKYAESALKVVSEPGFTMSDLIERVYFMVPCSPDLFWE